MRSKDTSETTYEVCTNEYMPAVSVRRAAHFFIPAAQDE